MRKFLKSFVYAFNGIFVSAKDHRNLIVQIVIALITVAAGFHFRITPVEWCIILLTISIVIGFEMINTAMEDLVDLVTQERKPLAGRIKDIAAGAVLFAAVIAVMVGVMIFKKYVFQ